MKKKQGIQASVITLNNSLGFLYKNIAVLIGLSMCGEGKMMGLSAYGRSNPELNIFRAHIQLHIDGSYFINNRKIFEVCEQLVKDAKEKFNQKALFQFYADIAFKVQQIIEEILVHCCNHLYQVTQMKNLCLAGGVALNCVANRKILNQTPFEKIFIQPAAGDNGISIGCATYGTYVLQHLKRDVKKMPIFTPYLGKAYTDKEIQKAVKKFQNNLFEETKYYKFFKKIALLISEGKIVGWFQGRSEVGPRALGNRSILADPRKANVKDILNEKVKHREPFRPFAPAVLEEKAAKYFEDNNIPSKYMLITHLIKSKAIEEIPATTHVDQTARLQIVYKQLNPRFHKLITAFEVITGVPVVLNTSFNDREPIVESPEDAIRCFLNTKIDVLVLNNRIFYKTKR